MGPHTPNGCPFHPEATPLERTVLGRMECGPCARDPGNLDGVLTAPAEAIVDVEWERGICLCDCCGAVLRVIPRPHREPRVVDADGRGHLCERYLAATLGRHGVPGTAGIVAAHARRPVGGPALAPQRPGADPDGGTTPIWKAYPR